MEVFVSGWDDEKTHAASTGRGSHRTVTEVLCTGGWGGEGHLEPEDRARSRSRVEASSMKASVSRRDDEETHASLRIDRYRFSRRVTEVLCVGRGSGGREEPWEPEDLARQR